MCKEITEIKKLIQDEKSERKDDLKELKKDIKEWFKSLQDENHRQDAIFEKKLDEKVSKEEFKPVKAFVLWTQKQIMSSFIKIVSVLVVIIIALWVIAAQVLNKFL